MNNINHTIVIKPTTPLNPQAVALANRILEIEGAPGRLIVRNPRTGAIRIFTKEYCFQFLPDSPEIIEVEDYEGSLTAGCALAMAHVREQMEISAQIVRREMGKTEEAEANAKALRKTVEENTSMLRAGQFRVTALMSQKRTIQQEAANLLAHWPKRTAKGNAAQAKKFLKAITEKIKQQPS